jgi:8-oxo-dGTP pyrophosphatase MutT (NUDIX family)
MLAEGQIMPIEDLEILVEPHEHPFEATNRQAIARHWRDETRANPDLYDGHMMLGRAAALSGRRLQVAVRRVDFSTFLYWRRHQPVEGVCHVFGCPVIVSRDGAVLAIRMAGHTANAGRIYCPSGSLDEGDVVQGRCDMKRNMRREVLEETGLDLDDADAEPALHLLVLATTLIVIRRYRFDQPISRLVEAVERHAARATEPEIDGCVAIRSVDDITRDFHFHMPAILAWHFSAGLQDDAQAHSDCHGHDGDPAFATRTA